MWIDVTKDHINDGIEENEMECPIALAVCDAIQSDMPDEFDNIANVVATVHRDSIEVHYDIDGEIEYQFNLSPKSECEWKVLNDFMDKFDGGYPIEPFTMKLEVNN